jgi:replication factor A1
MSGRGAGRGKGAKGYGKGKGKGYQEAPYGRGRGKGKGKGKGKGNGKAHDDDDDAPTEKTLPTFTKLKDVKPGTRSYDLVVQVAEVTLDSSRTERRRAGRTITVKCGEAIVGDETGCILLTTRQQDKAEILTEGAYYALLNVKMRRVQETFWIDVDNWSAIKPLDECRFLIPEDFDTNFTINKDMDRTKKMPPKPVFCEVDGLEPEKKGVHIICKVLEVKTEERSRLDGTTTKTATATVGDKKGCIVLIARGAHIDVLKQDAVLVIFNAHIEMYNKGFMRLVVDRWSDMKPLESVQQDLLPADHVTSDTVVDAKANKSEIEWVLQEER